MLASLAKQVVKNYLKRVLRLSETPSIAIKQTIIAYLLRLPEVLP